MSKLNQAEDRTLQALDRLERACRAALAAGRGGRHAAAAAAPEAARDEGATAPRLEAEALRRELTGLRSRRDRLLAVVGEVEARVDGVIDQLDEIAGR
jgi:hypothetical protein